jgi:hypothetical protein
LWTGEREIHVNKQIPLGVAGESRTGAAERKIEQKENKNRIEGLI